MRSKCLFLTCVVVVLGLSVSGFATTWNGSAGNGLWKTGSNWDGGNAPTTGNATFYYYPGQSVTIDNGTVATCAVLEGLGWYGNTNQGVLTIQSGGSLDASAGVVLGEGGPSKLILDGGTIDATGSGVYFYVGHNKAGIFQMNSGSADIETLYVTVASGSGQVHLDGGVLTIKNWLAINSYGSLDITNGVMYLKGDYTNTTIADGSVQGIVNGYVSSNKLTAFGGTQQIQRSLVTIGESDYTMFAVPEPMTMSLFGLGALALIRRK